MKYTKPAVTILGAANALIETVETKQGAPFDANGTQLTGPAYDLDE